MRDSRRQKGTQRNSLLCGYQDFETDKLVCVDVKATDERGRVFVIEVQIVVQSSFAKRAVFYACEAYTDQLRAGQGYNDLKANR